jgi:hypothetical protein
MLGLALVIGYGALGSFVAMAHSPWADQFAYANGDLSGYLDGARRFLATGSPYLPEQIAGYWHLQPHSFINPPSALPLFLPFLWLPAILWWVIPIVGTAVLMIAWRPAPWTWPLIAFCLLWPRTQGSILAGNTDLWAALIASLGCRYGWPFVFLIVKPSFAPVALLAARDRRFWIAAIVVVVVMLPLVPIWIDYVAVVRNTDIGVGYSLFSSPLVAMPVVAWWGRRRSCTRSDADRSARSPTAAPDPSDPVAEGGPVPAEVVR